MSPRALWIYMILVRPILLARSQPIINALAVRLDIGNAVCRQGDCRRFTPYCSLHSISSDHRDTHRLLVSYFGGFSSTVSVNGRCHYHLLNVKHEVNEILSSQIPLFYNTISSQIPKYNHKVGVLFLLKG